MYTHLHNHNDNMPWHLYKILYYNIICVAAIILLSQLETKAKQKNLTARRRSLYSRDRCRKSALYISADDDAETLSRRKYYVQQCRK